MSKTTLILLGVAGVGILGYVYIKNRRTAPSLPAGAGGAGASTGEQGGFWGFAGNLSDLIASGSTAAVDIMNASADNEVDEGEGYTPGESLGDFQLDF